MALNVEIGLKSCSAKSSNMGVISRDTVLFLAQTQQFITDRRGTLCGCLMLHRLCKLCVCVIPCSGTESLDISHILFILVDLGGSAIENILMRFLCVLVLSLFNFEPAAFIKPINYTVSDAQFCWLSLSFAHLQNKWGIRVAGFSRHIHKW